MIWLTRLSGTAFLLNADLIERVDCTPDTVVTLVDGTKYVVLEPLEAVQETVVAYRAGIVARAAMPDAASVVPLRSDRPAGPVGSAHGSRLTAVPSDSPDRHRGGIS